MGASQSSHVISLQTAEQRLGEELGRVKKCFAAVVEATSHGPDGAVMSQSQFCNSVFCSPFAPSVARALFNICDTRERGFLEESDFVIALAVFTRGTVPEKLLWLFRIYDVDRDGFVNRHDLKAMLSVDILTLAIPPGEVGKFIDDAAKAAVPEEDGPGLTLEAFSEWVSQHKNFTSLAGWALSADAAPLQVLDGGAAAAAEVAPMIAKQMDPVEQMVVSLKFSRSSKWTAMKFLRARGYEGPEPEHDSGEGGLRQVCEWLVKSELPSSQRLCWAFLGRRPPTAQLEREVVAWIAKQCEADVAADDKGKGERLEDSVEMAIAPPSGSEAEDVRYLISSGWYKLWTEERAAVPIDNTVLLRPGSFNLLQPNLQEGADFVTVLPHVWSALRHWHGGGPAIQRPYIVDMELVEVYSMRVQLFVRKSPRPAAALQFFCDEKLDLQVSRRETVAMLKTSLCSRLGCRIFFARLWLIGPDSHFALLSRETDTVTQGGISDGCNVCLEMAFADGTWPLDSDERVQTSGKAVAAASTAEAHRSTGSLRVGLRNLGNTCYMNAALQCLLATPVFSRAYFASGLYRKELCLDNPIGFGGRIAWEYGRLIQGIASSTSDVFVPLSQKSQIGACNPDFSGFRQHDSQELLMWLLDALHEDLNRVVTKPYLEDPDDKDPSVSDQELAAAFWANHKARNDSIVVDLFYGQIKSTLKCGKCANVSRKFDVFSSLGLPLPPEDMRLVELLLHPLTSPAFPTRFGFRLPKNAKILDLKRKLFELTGHKPRAVALFSVWNCRHDRLFNNFDTLDAVRDQETLHAYVVEGTNPKLLLCNPPPRIDFSGPALKADDSSDDEPGCFGMFGGGGGGGGNKKRAKKGKVIKTQHPLPPGVTLPADGAKAPAATKETPKDEDDEEMVGGGNALASQTAGSLNCCYVQVLHRRVEPAPETALFSSLVPRLFGWPLLMSFRVADYNTEQLYARVWERVKHLISHDYALHRDAGAALTLGENQYPFRLSVVNHSGLACAVCNWNKFCVGCPLSDKLLNIDRHLVLGVDWNLQVLRTYFNSDAVNKAETHPSVQQNRDLQDYPVSLDECLELFGREEQLEEYYCSRCKEFCPATKRLSLFRLPPLMCIHLKRFQEHRGRWEKTNKIVQFPLKQLRLPAAAVGDASFSLYATICHYGGLGGGHYTSFTRMPEEQEKGFFYCDDSRTRPVEDDNMVVTRSAYVLFYAADGIQADTILANVRKDLPDLDGPRRPRSTCVML
jgi:ubiquitin C-terminal hydrolase/Ca2+-binding EF-hand superfamily protein